MKKLKVVFHESAIQDLEEIWLYTFQTWPLEQTDQYHDSIYKEIGFLARKPKSGRDFSHILHENMDIPNRV